VIDLSLSKVVKGKTWTICGTPDYMAPEIVRQQGHAGAVDWWGLGVLIFELINGSAPFHSSDEMETYRLILAMRTTFVKPAASSLRDLVSKLLTSQGKRLGTGKQGTSSILKHRWFSGVDWDGLLSRQLTAPIQPHRSSVAPSDASAASSAPAPPSEPAPPIAPAPPRAPVPASPPPSRLPVPPSGAPPPLMPPPPPMR
jgi:serine/threonine protein kinase